MYKAILIDDEALARQLLSVFLKDYPQIEITATCTDGFEGFKSIQKWKPDLIFLDVQMPKISGFEMLEMLDEIPAVIFTTAFDTYAFQAFESNAIDYLLKPITRDRFRKAMDKFLQNREHPIQAAALQHLIANQQQEPYQSRIVVKDNSTIRVIPAKTIFYIEANDDYVKIAGEQGSFLKKATLSSIEASLNPRQFIRVHRSYIMAVSQLKKIEPYEKDSFIAHLHCGARVPVSRSGMQKLKAQLSW